MPLLELWCYVKVFDVIVHECTYKVYDVRQASFLFMRVINILKFFMISNFTCFTTKMILFLLCY